MKAQMLSPTIAEVIAEREELSLRCNSLKAKLQDVGEEDSLTRIEKTALAE